MSQNRRGLKLSRDLLKMLDATGYVEPPALCKLRMAAHRLLELGDSEQAWQLLYSDQHFLMEAPDITGSYYSMARQHIASQGARNSLMELGPILYIAGTWNSTDHLASYTGQLQHAFEFVLGPRLSTSAGEFLRGREIGPKARFLLEALTLRQAWEEAQQESMRRWRAAQTAKRDSG